MKPSKIISLVLCICLFVGCMSLPSYAVSKEEAQQKLEELQNESEKIQAEIKKLKNKKNEQVQLKKALESKINNLQAQIYICNDNIEKNNEKIAANEAEIALKNKEMEKAIHDFKKRIRTIYMSNSTAGGLEILLGADDFADFIALSQLTQNVSKRDKKMVDDIVKEIKIIEEKTAENKKLIEEQKAIKAELVSKQNELDKDAAQIQSVINGIQSDVNSEEAEQKKLDAEIEKIKQELSQGAVSTSPFSGVFVWPVPGFTNRTSDYGSRWNRLHAGIDISQSGIRDARVVAAASGTVTVKCNTCTHNYQKVNKYGGVYSCACGGYGNYLYIDHGIFNGEYFRTVYAHLGTGSICVSSGQYVGQGQMVGRVGTTGRSSGYHLHFEVRHGSSKNGLSPDNPMKFY